MNCHVLTCYFNELQGYCGGFFEDFPLRISLETATETSCHNFQLEPGTGLCERISSIVKLIKLKVSKLKMVRIYYAGLSPPSVFKQLIPDIVTKFHSFINKAYIKGVA